MYLAMRIADVHMKIATDGCRRHCGLIVRVIAKVCVG